MRVGGSKNLLPLCSESYEMQVQNLRRILYIYPESPTREALALPNFSSLLSHRSEFIESPQSGWHDRNTLVPKQTPLLKNPDSIHNILSQLKRKSPHPPPIPTPNKETNNPSDSPQPDPPPCYYRPVHSSDPNPQVYTSPCPPYPCSSIANRHKKTARNRPDAHR